jgi:hypothetical protein
MAVDVTYIDWRLILSLQDPLVSSYIPRVLPLIQNNLNQFRGRLSILPNPSQQTVDAARAVSEVQTILSRRPGL